MPSPLYPDFRPDRAPFTALNRLAADVEALRNAEGGGDVSADVSSGGLVVRDERPRAFLAKITGAAVGGAYPWERLVSYTGGNNAQDGWAQTGTAASYPAYEAGGSTTVANNSIVLMWPADSLDEMRFLAPPVETAASSGDPCTDPLDARTTTLDIYRPFGAGAPSSSNVACTYYGDLPRGRGSGLAGLLVWTAYVDVANATNILDGCSRPAASDAPLFADGDEVRIPTGASSPRYVVVWVEQGLDDSGTLIKRVYLLRNTA